jgi:hypothetical protein
MKVSSLKKLGGPEKGRCLAVLSFVLFKAA